jgi:hypothetical protein
MDDDFAWIPNRLLTVCSGIIESHHKKFDFAELNQTPWDKDSMTLVGCRKYLLGLLSVGSKTWTQKKRKVNFVKIASMMVAIEMIGNNFAE